MAQAKQRLYQGETHSTNLQRFRVESGLSWEAINELWEADADLAPTFSVQILADTSRAELFWSGWRDAKILWQAAVALDQVEPRHGEWGFLEKSEIPSVLPGFTPPAGEMRREFAVRLVANANEAAELWFYSRSYRPAFRVELPQPAD